MRGVSTRVGAKAAGVGSLRTLPRRASTDEGPRTTTAASPLEAVEASELQCYYNDFWFNIGAAPRFSIGRPHVSSGASKSRVVAGSGASEIEPFKNGS